MPKFKIKAIGDRILIQHVEDKEQVRGRVIIPHSARESRRRLGGTGPKAKGGVVMRFEVKVGDTVVIGKFAGSEVKLEHEKYTLVREDGILGVRPSPASLSREISISNISQPSLVVRSRNGVPRGSGAMPAE
jgi:chaperonin GroES